MSESRGEPTPSKRSRAFRDRCNGTINALLLRPTGKRAENVYNSLRQLGYNEGAAREIIRAAQKRKRGAPPDTQLLYLKAFRRMLMSKDMSLGKVMDELCDCGRETHKHCRPKFQTGIRRIKKWLPPELVAEYDRLHPDRAKHSRSRMET